MKSILSVTVIDVKDVDNFVGLKDHYIRRGVIAEHHIIGKTSRCMCLQYADNSFSLGRGDSSLWHKYMKVFFSPKGSR